MSRTLNARLRTWALLCRKWGVTASARGGEYGRQKPCFLNSSTKPLPPPCTARLLPAPPDPRAPSAPCPRRLPFGVISLGSLDSDSRRRWGWGGVRGRGTSPHAAGLPHTDLFSSTNQSHSFCQVALSVQLSQSPGGGPPPTPGVGEVRAALSLALHTPYSSLPAFVHRSSLSSVLL